MEIELLFQMFLNLAVAVGGHREFPDGSISGEQKKPWKNSGSRVRVYIIIYLF